MKINEVLDEKIQQARLEPLSVPNLNTKLSTSKDNSVEQQIQNAFAKALDKNNKDSIFTGDETKVATFIGPKAEVDWNSDAAKNAAAAYAKDGADLKDIFNKYGVLFGADKHARQEISNHLDKFLIDPSEIKTGMKLSDIVDMPGVNANYPHLAKNITIAIGPKANPNNSAWVNTKTGVMGIPMNPTMSDIAHETQHVVDKHEEFAPGLSSYWSKRISDESGGKWTDENAYFGTPSEIFSFATDHRVGLTPDQRSKQYPRYLHPNSQLSPINVVQDPKTKEYEITPIKNHWTRAKFNLNKADGENETPDVQKNPPVPPVPPVPPTAPIDWDQIDKALTDRPVTALPPPKRRDYIKGLMKNLSQPSKTESIEQLNRMKELAGLNKNDGPK